MGDRRVLALLGLLPVLGCETTAPPACPAPADPAPPAVAAPSVEVTADGRWQVAFARPAFAFTGAVGSAVTDLTTTVDRDDLGGYRETWFRFGDRAAAIRAYDAAPVVLFTDVRLTAGANVDPFPRLQPPALPYHLAYRETMFAPPDLDGLAPDSPWIFFDDDARSYVISAADHFMNAAATRAADGAIAAGIDPAVTTLPAGFIHRTVLVAGEGIGHTLGDWGRALTTWSGKPRVASDATVELERLGYFTDNGATYYYGYDADLGYADTLLAVKDAFAAAGTPLGYLQLDSWWYPKGASQSWQAKGDGIYVYDVDPTLFPAGLGAFHDALGLPLIVHARWIDPASPYRTTYAMSNDVIVDGRYWRDLAQRLRAAGVATYEQDWLDGRALPATDNLVDQDAFLDEMAEATSAAGLGLQYCMPLPRHHLQGTRYPNLHTIRVSVDRWKPERWRDALYVSQLAYALGVWPWVDVFMSSEHENLLLATLSAGMVAVGDPRGALDAAALRTVARPDGVLVKPDVPLQPLDRSIIADAAHTGAPPVGAAYTDHGDHRAAYVFVLGDGSARLRPAELGLRGLVVAFDRRRDQAQHADASDELSIDGYQVLTGVGASGIALLGDTGKLVPRGRKRVEALEEGDDGTLTVTLAFAAGEGPPRESIELAGWATVAPTVTARQGSVGPVRYADHVFRVDVTPAQGRAVVALRAAPRCR